MKSTIYIVAGGPSLHNYDWKLLRAKRVIAVNRAYRHIPWAEVVYFTDGKFFDDHKDHGLLESDSALVTLSDTLVSRRVVKYLDTGEEGMDFHPGCLRNGKNSGYAAINLAVHMGATKIILLGFDMGFGVCDVTHIQDKETHHVNGRTHWHEGYLVKPTVAVYDRMIPMFETLLDPLEQMGIEVLNACMESRIHSFDKIPLEKAHIDSLLGAG